MPSAIFRMPASVWARKCTPIGTPVTPPSTNGQTRLRSTCLRCGQIVLVCSRMPQPVIRIAECNGSMRCSQIAEAASPKAKPLAPAAMPPSSAPSHKMASVSSGRPNSIRSAQMEHKDEPDGEHRRDTNRQCCERLFAEIEEFDGEHAQAQRHVDRQRDDDA